MADNTKPSGAKVAVDALKVAAAVAPIAEKAIGGGASNYDPIVQATLSIVSDILLTRVQANHGVDLTTAIPTLDEVKARLSEDFKQLQDTWANQ